MNASFTLKQWEGECRFITNQPYLNTRWLDSEQWHELNPVPLGWRQQRKNCYDYSAVRLHLSRRLNKMRKMVCEIGFLFAMVVCRFIIRPTLIWINRPDFPIRAFRFSHPAAAYPLCGLPENVVQSGSWSFIMSFRSAPLVGTIDGPYLWVLRS